ncbi:protein FAM162A-like [Acanthaster planci]|uniref:Protein FAM162A-like n=1 Tax=Acanthaster planci TaxID=133434 RepID=A0A8B7ZRD8_ACAPL|nr:protein FAM162A-like [Acanthaster planci]
MFASSRLVAIPRLRISSRYFTTAKFTCQNNCVSTRARSVPHVHVGQLAWLGNMHDLSGSRVGLLSSFAAFRAYATGKEVEKIQEPQTSRTGSESSTSSESATVRARAPTNIERKIFVWTGKYKTVDEVPELVSEAALMSSKTKFRIYINLGMGAATLLAAISMIIMGRSRAKKGESVSGMNMKRHREMYSRTAAAEDAQK